MNKSFTILQNNVRGLNDFDYFSEWKANVSLLPFSCDIMVLSEVKLKHKSNTDLYKIKGYDMHCCLRNSKFSKGGILLYVRSSIQHTVSNTSTTFEIMSLKLSLNSREFNVIAAYRPPVSSNSEEFLEALESAIVANPCRLAIVGDINYDVNSTSRENTKYLNLLEQYDIKILNTFPTRPVSGKTIDHFACNFYDDHSMRIYTIDQDPAYTDHSMVIAGIELSCERNKNSTVVKTSIDFGRLIDSFECNLTDLLSCDDPNTIANIIQKSTQVATQKCTRVDEFKVKNSDKLAPWYNSELLFALKKKDSLYVKWKKKPSDHVSKQNYLAACTRFTETNNRLRNNFYNLKLSTNDPKKTWKTINDITGRSKHKEEFVSIFDSNNVELTDKKLISNAFNKFFTIIPEHENVVLPSHQSTVPSNIASKSIFLNPADNEEVSKVIRNLKSNSAAGADGISPRVVKKLRYQLVPLLVVLINQIFNTGIYPDSFKEAIVLPVFKSGNKKSMNNYRPISILTIFNKIVEKVLHNRISKFLNKHNLLNIRQYGFRKSASTESAAFEVSNYIQNALNNKKKVSATFIDLKKAFDSVYHHVLFDTLHDKGVRGKCHDILKSYLCNRSQQVKINGMLGDALPITRGVVQGSVLGPLLFIMIIDSIMTIDFCGEVILYADDAVILNTHERKDHMEPTIRSDMLKALAYFNSKKLMLNQSKTVYMAFHSPSKIHNISNSILITDSFSLHKVDAFKYLGLWLDTHLTFDMHTKKLEAKIAPAVGALWKLRKVIPLVHKKLIYNSLLSSHLTYLTGCWGSATDKAIKNIQMMQNRGLRNVFNMEWKANRVSMYKTKDELPIRGICVQRTLSFVHSLIYGYKNSTLTLPLPSLKRSGLHIRATAANNSYGEKIFSRLGVNIFNSLPEEIKSTNQPFKFNRQVKSHILKSNWIDKFFSPHNNFMEIFKKYSQKIFT